MKKIFIIAGEASGDYLGGKLMEDIKSLSKEKVEFVGIGGTHMEKAGLKEIFSINELSIIGIVEVIKKIFHVKKLINKTVEEIFSYKPDVVITIDSSGFTHRVNKKIKKNIKKINPSWNLPIVHYVAPPVWAWRKWRAASMHKFIDKLLVLLPFEEEIFKEFNLKTVFVGHPIATDPDFNEPSVDEKISFLTENGLEYNKHENSNKQLVITLLAGSRKSEINKHLPILSEFMKMISKKYKNAVFFMPIIESLKSYVNEFIDNFEHKPIVISEKSKKTLAYYVSDIAVAASGTVTLELARTKLTSVIIYKTSFITSKIIKFLIKIKHVCLINILAKKEIVPELLQDNCTAENIFNKTMEILENRFEYEKQKSSFDNVMNLLNADDQKKSAKEILNLISKK